MWGHGKSGARGWLDCETRQHVSARELLRLAPQIARETDLTTGIKKSRGQFSAGELWLPTDESDAAPRSRSDERTR